MVQIVDWFGAVLARAGCAYQGLSSNDTTWGFIPEVSEGPPSFRAGMHSFRGYPMDAKRLFLTLAVHPESNVKGKLL